MKHIKNIGQAQKNRKAFDEFITSLMRQEKETFRIISPTVSFDMVEGNLYRPDNKSTIGSATGTQVPNTDLANVYHEVELGLVSVFRLISGDREKIFYLAENWTELVEPEEWESEEPSDSPFATWISSNLRIGKDLGFSEWKRGVVEDARTRRGLQSMAREYIRRGRAFGFRPLKEIIKTEIASSYGVKEHFEHNKANGNLEDFWEKIDWIQEGFDSGEFLKFKFR